MYVWVYAKLTDNTSQYVTIRHYMQKYLWKKSPCFSFIRSMGEK